MERESNLKEDTVLYRKDLRLQSLHGVFKIGLHYLPIYVIIKKSIVRGRRNV